MAGFPPEFIHQLIERADIAEIVGTHVKLKQRGQNFWGLCPFHNEKTPSFSVNPDKAFYHCFGCGAHGNVIDFLAKIHGGGFVDGIETLSRLLGVAVPRSRRETEAMRAADDARGVLRDALMHWRRRLENSAAAQAYLKKRGVTAETIARFEIAYAADSPRDLLSALAGGDKQVLINAGLVREKEGNVYDYFRDRIIFPISDGSKRLCGFGGRAISDDSQVKYLNSADSAFFSKRRILYGLPLAREAAQKKKRLLICEGYMDVVMLAQAGFAEAVATMGTAATPEQMRKAAQAAPTIVFAFDGDAAGQQGAKRALAGVLPALKDGTNVSFLFLPEGHDPDSYIRQSGAAAFEALITAAEPLSEFMANALQQAAAAADGGGVTGMMKEGERLLRLLNINEARYWRQLLSERLAEKAGVGTGTIQKAIKQPPRRTRISGYRMKPEDKLFNLLCCLTINPGFIDKLQHDIPLPGASQDADIVAGVLSKLRWNMDDEPPGVLTVLADDGYTALVEQINRALVRRFNVTENIDAEFEALIKGLRQAHRRLTAKGEWLKKISEVT